jgi:hypothetical protein
MRFAILTAVSSKVQAADGKDSLPVQEENCRRAALARSWVETSGPFVISGQPRTGYVNLSLAESEIPALRSMLNAAQAGLFDVLVIYDYSRLRDLIALVATSLADYNVQIFSLAQAVEPAPPADFDPALSDASWFSQTAASMTSRAEINALRRRYKIGMPGRVTNKGLHPTGPLPYGYRKPVGQEFNRQAIPEPDPATAPAVLIMKDLLLSGRSLHQIARTLDAGGYRTRYGKPWHPSTIGWILRNSFYSGIVTFGVLKHQRDSRLSRKTRAMRSTAPVQSATGKHTPLWDETTRHRLLDELKRRSKAYSGRRLSRLSGLLLCSVCGRVLWVGYRTWKGHPPSDNNRIYFCAGKSPGHPRIKESDLLPVITARLQHDLSHVEDIPLPASSHDPLPLLRKQSADLEKRLSRLTEAYLSGTILLPEFTTLKAGLVTRQVKVSEDLLRAEDTASRQAERLGILQTLTELITGLSSYIQVADQQTVNSILRQAIESITITPDGVIDLEWRG